MGLILITSNNVQLICQIFSFGSFKLIAGVNPVAVSTLGKRTISMNTPLTALEVFSKAMSDAFELETVANISYVKASLLSTKQYKLNSQLGVLVHSDPITLIIPDLNVCPPAGCAFSLVLQSVANVTYGNGSSMAPSRVTQCDQKPKPFNTTYFCPDDLFVTSLCDVNSAGQEITVQCPYFVTKPNCGRILSSTSSVSDDICTLASSTSTQTSCQCQVPIALFADDLQVATITSKQKFAGGPSTIVPSNFNEKIRDGGLTDGEIAATVILVVLGSIAIIVAAIYLYIVNKRKESALPTNKIDSMDRYDLSLKNDSATDVHRVEGDIERYYYMYGITSSIYTVLPLSFLYTCKEIYADVHI
jgi:hypothetical protein